MTIESSPGANPMSEVDTINNEYAQAHLGIVGKLKQIGVGGPLMRETGDPNDQGRGLVEVGWFVPDAGKGALYIVPGTEALVVAGAPEDGPASEYYKKATQPQSFDGKYSIGGYNTASDFINAAALKTNRTIGTFVFSDQTAPDWANAASTVIGEAKIAAMEPKKQALGQLKQVKI